MPKRTSNTDINHENWNQEEKPEEAGTFQVAPAAVLETRQIKLATRRRDKSSASGNDVAEVKGSSWPKSGSKVPVSSVFQNLSSAFLSRPELVINQSTKMSSYKDTSNSTILPTTSTSFQNSSTGTLNAKWPTNPIKTRIVERKPNTFSKECDTLPSIIDMEERVTGDCWPTMSSSKLLPTLAAIRPAVDKTKSNVDLDSTGNFVMPVQSVEYPAADMSEYHSMNLISAGIKIAVRPTDHTTKPPNASTGVETKPIIKSTSCWPSAEGKALDKMDSRNLLKPIPEDILERLRVKAVTTSKSLHFLERVYQLNTTTTDWLSLLIQEDLTINLSDVMPSYMHELLKLMDEEVASQDSQAVKAALFPHQKQLEQMLAIFREARVVGLNGDKSSTEPKAENLPNSRPRPNVSNSNFVMNQLQSPLQSTRMKINQDSAWQGMNANKGEQDDSQEKFGFGFFKKMQNAPPVVNEEYAKNRGEEEENDDDAAKDNPFTPVIEADSLCSMRCKVFVRKDPSDTSETPYQNRGVGTLFVKPISTGKVQVVVRADNSLGNIILNVCITTEMPVQVANDTTLMLVCCPMSGEPPRTVLIRVKNKEEVELLHKNLVTV